MHVTVVLFAVDRVGLDASSLTVNVLSVYVNVRSLCHPDDEPGCSSLVLLTKEDLYRPGPIRSAVFIFIFKFICVNRLCIIRRAFVRHQIHGSSDDTL